MADNPLFLSTHDVAPSAKGASPDTGGAGIGDLRRRYAFGDRVSELAIDQTPFFRFLSMASKKPTDDPTFKFTEKRGSYHKRYAYLEAFGSSFNTALDTVIISSVKFLSTASGLIIDNVCSILFIILLYKFI